MELKDFYLSKIEVEKALEKYNQGRPRDQWLFYTTSFDSYRNRWLYIPCTEEFFHLMRNGEYVDYLDCSEARKHGVCKCENNQFSKEMKNISIKFLTNKSEPI